MILFERRETIESAGVRRVFEGMRARFPDQVPGWFAKLDQATNLSVLGSDIADGLAEEIQQYGRAKAQQAAARQPPVQASSSPESEKEIKRLEFLLKLAESARQESKEHVRDAYEFARQAQHKADDDRKAIAEQMERLTLEIVDLQRIVGEQQFLLNQRSEKPE